MFSCEQIDSLILNIFNMPPNSKSIRAKQNKTKKLFTTSSVKAYFTVQDASPYTTDYGKVKSNELGWQKLEKTQFLEVGKAACKATCSDLFPD